MAGLDRVAEEQQVVDQHAHTVGLLLDPPHRLGEVFRTLGRTATEQLGVPANGGQWRSQLMGRIAHEAPQPRLGRSALVERVLDLLQHLVERESQPPDLGVFVGGLDAL